MEGVEFTDVVRQRRMVRRYESGRGVERATVDHLLDLARRAPSAGFTQGGHFLVLETDADRSAFWAATADQADAPDGWLTGMRGAPVLIVVLSDRAAYERRYRRPDKQARSAHPGAPDPTLEQRWPVAYWDIDAGMAALLILLGAVDAALAACWFGVPTHRVDALRRRFGVPAELVPVGVVSLGYPAPDVNPRDAARDADPRSARAPDAQVREAVRAGHRPRRRSRTEVVSYDRYGSTDWSDAAGPTGHDDAGSASASAPASASEGGAGSPSPTGSDPA